MRHIERVEIKKEGMIEQRQKQDLDEKSIGREIADRTFHYYDKMRRSIQNSILPIHFDRSKSKGNLRDSKNQVEFHPEINEKSKKMKRSGSVGDILYEDALR